jgi:hypothetical protein
MVGARGHHVARLFELLPDLVRLERLDEQAAAMAAAVPHAQDARDVAAAEAAAEAAEAAATTARADLFDLPKSCTDGLAPREWLSAGLPWTDPITGSPLPAPSAPTPPSLFTVSPGGSLCHGSSLTNEPTVVWWDGEVECDRLLPYLKAVADRWLGEGIAAQVELLQRDALSGGLLTPLTFFKRPKVALLVLLVGLLSRPMSASLVFFFEQVAAFRSGLGDMVALKSGMLAFDATELRDLFCGPDR